MPVAGIMNGVNHHFGSLHFSWLMFLLLIWIGGSSPDPCAYMSTPNKKGNTPRLASGLIPSTVTLTALDDKGVEITHDKISFCLIKNGNTCMRGLDDSDSFPEYEAFEQMLQSTLGIPPLERRSTKSNDYILEDHLEDLFKGIICEEGFCGKGGECEPCSSCAKNYVRYQTVQRSVRRVNTEADLRRKINRMVCGRVRGEDDGGPTKSRDFGLKEVARIQIKKDGPEFLIQHCAIAYNDSCLPQSTEEFELLKERLLTAKVVNSSLLNFGDLDNSPSTENRSFALKSWNCKSGVCDPKTLKCRDSRFPRRKYRVWKVYEYMDTSGVGVPTIRDSADGMPIYLLLGYTTGSLLNLHLHS